MSSKLITKQVRTFTGMVDGIKVTYILSKHHKKRGVGLEYPKCIQTYFILTGPHITGGWTRYDSEYKAIQFLKYLPVKYLREVKGE